MSGALLVLALACPLALDDPQATSPDQVSYYKQVRPILQANCQGCHQPAKAGGKLVLTGFDRLMAGGASEMPLVVAGQPDESFLLDSITPGDDGQAHMPQGKPPLHETDRETLQKWIAQGATDDTPPNALARYDADHLPIYSRPPVIGKVDISPDGTLLAVAGFHEVLLWKADGSELVARLVGMSERIESVRFSPDGKRLAVTAGNPGRLGEVQVWDVDDRELTMSAPISFDTVNGASWSPDGKMIAFGCTDNSVRAIDSKTGEQVLFMGGHNDWPLDTVFSKDGSHLISVGRDMAVKLTEVATQRFVDNVTSITPGALKGGVQAIARHPERDELVIGGSDGIPKVYRTFRLVNRVIGDDSNIIRQLPAMPGRIFGVAVSRDGKRIAAASSHDDGGQVNVYGYEFDTALPDDIKAIMAKVSTSRSADEAKQLDEFTKQGVRLISELKLASPAYTVAFAPDGKVVAAGADGLVRIIDGETGSVVKEFAPAPVATAEEIARTEVRAPDQSTAETDSTTVRETLPEGVTIASLDVEPKTIRLVGPFAYAQLVVTATKPDGSPFDATRMADTSLSTPVADLAPSGIVSARAEGTATLVVALGGKQVEIPVEVQALADPTPVDFVRDINPILSRLGCNQGTCHGSAQGKNGFKLSLRGYDPLFDIRALTDDHASRRVSVASPDDSLMLLKPTGAVPHVGGVMMKPGTPYYQVVRDWIAGGAKLDPGTPKVAKLDVFPINPILPDAGARQQLRVVATYTDGKVRDVTREAFSESGNIEVASAAVGGLMTALRRGEAPILVRFEGAYAATTLTVMGDRSGFAWEAPPAYGKIDELAASKWERMKIRPSELCSDPEFLRRAHLDLTGLPPSADEVRAFLADPRDSKVKREEVVDRLIGSPDFVDYWTNKWADLLQVNRKFLDVEGAKAFRDWIRAQVDQNVPYDQFVRSILTAKGSTKENPAASYYKILRAPDLTMENTTQLFLAVRFNCNKCHDHPFERWTQDQYYETAAYFAQTSLEPDPASGDRRIGGSAVEGSTPLYEFVEDAPSGEMKHERTGKDAPPEFPYDCDYEAPADSTRREQLAAWMTSPDNAYFAKSYANRIWGYLMGVGLIDPLDDIRAGNPPSNPELLDYLTTEFISSGFDARHLMRLIAKSRTYQLSVASNKWNEDDKINFSHAMARRLPAEVLLDAVYKVTGSTSNIPGVPAGTRAAALPDSGVELPSGFLNTFGRPVRESACECERSSGLQLGPVMALVSGPTLADAIADPKNALAGLIESTKDDRELVNELFVRILNRPATDAEIDACLAGEPSIDTDHEAILSAVKNREAEVAAERPALEAAREAAIAEAKAKVTSYEQEIAAKVAEQEKQRAEKIAAAEAAVKEYSEKVLPGKLAAWERGLSGAVDWVVIEPKEMKASRKVKLTRMDDGSIFAEGQAGPQTYTIEALTDLEGITAVRLEALADDRLAAKGPGRAQNGNFVLTAFEVFAGPKENTDALKKVELRRPLADFAQAEFDISKAINVDPAANDRGWAISPSFGTTHWATFETKEDLGLDGGTALRFVLHHNYNDGLHSIGRFRLSVAVARRPVGLSLSDELRALLAVAPEDRSDEQKAKVLAYYQSAIDGEGRQKDAALAEARQPLPADPKLVALKADLEAASQAIPADPRLTQLLGDLAASEQQKGTRRLTFAQDVAWALINSPAFLFNH